jgi:hypothetical protein
MRFIVLVASTALLATPALAADSVTHASAAVTASGQAVGELATFGIQAVGGVSALPIGVAGGASQIVGAVVNVGGDSLGGAGNDLQRAADQAITDAWGPLRVDDRVVVRPDPAPKVPFNAQTPTRK